MQPIDVSKRTIGVNVKEEEIAVNIWAPFAKKVELELKIQERTEIVPLRKSEHGYWQASGFKTKEGTRYKIKVDDKPAFPDPASLSQPDGVHGESEVIDLSSFQWSKTTWSNLPLEEYIIYELHTGTFT
jgi:maltooligosyltrehalose trehalohydrolase